MTFRWFYILCAAVFFSTVRSLAQEIDNTSSYKNVNSDRYIRISGDDDFFAGTDDQYTEGLNIDICAPWIRKFPLTKLLMHPALENKGVKYGLNIEQEGYTPADLANEGISFGDRPFAATLYLNTYMIVTDYENAQRFATVLSTGIIGPSALGENLQDAAHVIINDIVPPGWKYQIRDDIILNYEWNYQKQLLSAGHAFSLDADAVARLGTLNDQISPGITLMAGYFNSPFSKNLVHKKYLFYFFDHPEVNFVGYDATLQGGVFDNSSPYTLPANDISRILFKNFAGITFINNRFTFQYFHCFETRQFTFGPDHSWDGIQLTTTFR